MKTNSLILKSLFLACAMFVFLPSHAEDVDGKPVSDPPQLRTKQEFKAAYEDLLQRRDALKEARKNATSQEEKQQIKEDIQEIKKEAKALKQQAISGGVYIGAGALLLIVLLILLL